MTFNPNIPQPGDFLSQSQGDILDNFIQTNTQFGVDHTAFNTGSGNGDGFHKKVTFPATPSPIPTPTGTQSTLYPNAVSGSQELFYGNAASLTQITSLAFPIWKGGTASGDGVVTHNVAANGYMKLPIGGLTFQWGSITFSGNTSSDITFAPAFSSAPYSIQVTIDTSTPVITYSVDSVTNTKFNILKSVTASKSFYWFAIGPT